MELEIEEIVENPLLHRKELRFRVRHPGAPTPKRVEVKAKLAEALGVGQGVIAIEKITSLHGKAESSGIARVYKTEEMLKSLEPKYLLEREKPPEEEKK